MAANSQCYVEWNEQYVSKERGKRVVHYFLKDTSGESVLAVVGTERSIRHMFYVVAEDFLKVNETDYSVNAGYRWRSRREVVNWLTSMLSKQHGQGEHSKSPKSEHILGVGASFQNRLAKSSSVRVPEIMWSGAAWTCSKQLKHFPAFCRNGITIAVQSFVYVMTEGEKCHLAYLEDMYEDRKGQKKVKIRWFHRTQEVQAAVTLKSPHPKEVFITPYAQVISAECVDGLALVLARHHYEKCVSTLPEDLLNRVHLCLRQFKNKRVKPFKLTTLGGYFDQPVFSVLDTDILEDEENSLRDTVKLGVKRPRSFREGQMSLCDSSNMEVKYEILRRKLIPKHVQKRDSNIMSFKVNEKIELLCLDSGIRGCWYKCTILQVSKKQMKVQYDDLMEEGGSGNLEEWVPAFRLAMPDKLGIRCSGRPYARPARMESENETNVAFEVGSPVDGWWNDGWWEGVVTKIGESDDADLQVYIPGENLVLELQKKNIRASKDWVGDRWIDLETKPNILSLIPANLDEIKPGIFPFLSNENPEPVDPPEPVNGSNDSGPLQPQPVNRCSDNGPLQPEPVNGSSDNSPLQPQPVNRSSDNGLLQPEPVDGSNDNSPLQQPVNHSSDNSPLQPQPVNPLQPEPVNASNDNGPLQPEPVNASDDSGPLQPEPVNASNDNSPLQPEPVNCSSDNGPLQLEPINGSNDNGLLQVADPDPEFHEKEKDPSSARDDGDLQVGEKGEHTSEDMEA